MFFNQLVNLPHLSALETLKEYTSNIRFITTVEEIFLAILILLIDLSITGKTKALTRL